MDDKLTTISQVLEHAPTGVVVVDERGAIAMVNAHAQALFGYDGDELLGQPIEVLVPERLRGGHEGFRAAFARDAVARPMGSGRELYGVRKDRREVPIEIALAPLPTPQGQFVVASVVDISERRRVQDALDAERRLLQAVLSGIDEGFTVQDAAGKLVYANQSGARLVGFESPEAMLAAPSGEIMRRFTLRGVDGKPVAPEDMPSRAVLAGKDAAPIVVEYVAAGTEERRWSHVRAYPVLDARGQLARVINVFRDVTEEHREEAQRALLLRAVERFNSSRDYHATLASIANEMVPALADWCAVDLLDGGEVKRLAVAHVDPAKVALVEEIARRFPTDPAAPTSPRSVMRTGKPHVVPRIPVEMIRAAARSAEHLALIDALQLHSAIVVPMLGRRGPIGTITVVSAESRRVYTEKDVAFASALADRAAIAIENASLVRELEATVARETTAREDAENAAKFSEMFIGIVSHDLRNPLTAISAGAQLLLRGADHETVRRTADGIVTSGDRMARMIDQLLDFTRIRLGDGLSLRPAPADLGALARQIADETEAAHRCAIEVAQRGDTAGSWDTDRLAQVFSNLLTNAATHGRKGRPILVRVDGTGADVVRVIVGNDGDLPAALLPELFEPFRGSREPRRGATGLGLGLYITKEIVRAHGGSITAASADGRTELDVRLPRAITSRT